MTQDILTMAPNFRRFTVEAVIAILFVLPAYYLIKNTGDVSVYLSDMSLDGQLLYVLSKPLGLYALLLMWLQIMMGLGGKNIFKYLAVKDSRAFHRNLGVTVGALVLIHIALFVAAVSIRNGHFAYKLLLPNLFGSYYPMMVSLGLLGAVALGVAIWFAIRRHQLKINWKWPHRLGILAYILAFIHSFAIGSESAQGAMNYVYLVMAGSLVIAILLKMKRNLMGKEGVAT